VPIDVSVTKRASFKRDGCSGKTQNALFIFHLNDGYANTPRHYVTHYHYLCKVLTIEARIRYQVNPCGVFVD
jgi:hypothetical protein